MRICIHCDKRLLETSLTSDEKCPKCNRKVYLEEELQAIYNKYCGFEVRHDLYDIQEELESVKRDPAHKTASGRLWIDVIIERLKAMILEFEKRSN